MSSANNDIPGVIAPPPLIYFVPLVLGILLHRLWPLRPGKRSGARWLGGSLLLAGIGGIVWALWTMRRAGTPPDPRHPVTHLVTHGPFGLSRNPVYLSFTTIYAGIALLVQSVWAIVFLPLVLLTMQRGVIEREERYLARRFGDDYRHYSTRVRRWL
jgi:protein-S-isoprenylcysteine O-methyltransferase Ste14